MSAVTRVSVQVPQDFGAMLQSYQVPESKEKADGVFKELFALKKVFTDRTSQPTSQEISRSITTLSTALEAYKEIKEPSLLAKTASKVPLLNRVISKETQASCSLQAAKKDLKALLAIAKTHEAEYNKELQGIERRYVALSVKKEPVSLAMLQGAINPALLRIEGQQPEDLEMVFTQLISQTNEPVDVETRVKTFAEKDAPIAEGLSGRDLALLQAASPAHFDSISKAFTKYCQGYTHKDKTPFFTPIEIADTRKVSITNGKVVHETEFQLVRKTGGEVFATVQAKLEDGSCEFYGISLISAIKPDLEKLNRVFTKQAKVEAAAGASIE